MFIDATTLQDGKGTFEKSTAGDKPDTMLKYLAVRSWRILGKQTVRQSTKGSGMDEKLLSEM